MKKEAQAFFSAMQFLTRLPTPAWTGWEAGRLDRATPHFTLVGGLIGLLCGAVYYAASLVTLPPAAALLALTSGILLTGALHEDGLADCADGLATNDPVRALAIMKDSHIGAFGVIALIVVLGLKATALASMPPLYGTAALIGAHGLSRAWLYPTVKALPYARDEAEAKVAPISQEIVTGEWVRTVLFAILTFSPIVIVAILTAPMRLIGCALAIAFTAVAMLATVSAMRKRLGGWTGDTLGAQQQTTETAFLIGASAWIFI